MFEILISAMLEPRFFEERILYRWRIFRENRKISLRIVADKYGAVYGSTE